MSKVILTSQQYFQIWARFLHKYAKLRRPLFKEDVLDFQESILDTEEIEKSNHFQLYLKPTDPRTDVWNLSEAKYRETQFCGCYDGWSTDHKAKCQRGKKISTKIFNPYVGTDK